MREDRKKSEIAYFILIAIFACLAGIALAYFNPQPFQPYFGAAPAWAAFILTAVIGYAALNAITRMTTGVVTARNWRRIRLYTLIAASIFALIAIVADLALNFSADLNIPWPSSLLFYPSMALVAEVWFHLAPIAMMLLAAAAFKRTDARTALPWLIIFIAAVIEPVFQIKAAMAGGALAAIDIFTIVHVFAFGVVQLWLFRRYGFAAMFMMRIFYYIWWHILWGSIRLSMIP